MLDEIPLHSRLLLNAGARYDHYPRFQRVTPRAALIFTAPQGGTFKYLYGTAFRAPNAYETDYYTYFNPLSQSHQAETLRAESITSHEIVWEKYTSDWFRSSISAYTNLLDGLIRLDADADGALFFANRDRVLARGVEFEAEVKTRRGFQALTSYALQETTDRDTQQGLTNSPGHAVKARVTTPSWSRGSSASAEVQYLSRRHTVAGDQVDPATIVNVSMVQSLRQGMSLTARVHNVFDQLYADPASEEHRQATIQQNGRTFVLNVRWALGR